VVAEGTFQLYPKIDPPLKAGLYRFDTQQLITATGPHGALDSSKMQVEELQTHVRVRSPQYVLPPDQVLSTFPPAGREGAFGARLPQVVIKRRTLPWERAVDDAHPDEPWLALVLIAEGEAEIRLNQNVTECVTPGVTLDPPADVEQGNCVAIRESVVRRIFPTQEEVRLLAHAREVDINDTELMMGDDDGFLAVVITNRLPLPGRDDKGNELPVKYLACLVNLCGQWDTLLDKAPVNYGHTYPPRAMTEATFTLADADQALMGIAARQAVDESIVAEMPKDTKGIDGPTHTTVANAHIDAGIAAPYVGASGWGTRSTDSDVGDLYARMASPFQTAATTGYLSGNEVLLDPELRFPCLLHWSFTSTGDETFEVLMRNLRSGLLGTSADAPAAVGRPPFEIVQTGQIGLDHRLRAGDQVRSWYRGPLVPHPTEDPPDGRLKLAHAADQIRTIVPDGREDISLAAAFEIGRLLGLSRPSIVAALLRWRQQGFQTAQLLSAFAALPAYAQAIDGLGLTVDRAVGGRLGALVAQSTVARPSVVLGDPAPAATSGRPLTDAGIAQRVLADGLGLDVQLLSGTPGAVLGRLQETPVALPDLADIPGSVGAIRDALSPIVADRFSRTAVQALAPQIREGSISVGDVARLPTDLQNQLDTAVTPSIAAVQARLGLHVEVAALPHSADPLDVLIPSSHDTSAEPEEGERRG
jgi:hypothetical protein